MAKSRFTEEDVTGMSADELVKEINWRVDEGRHVLFYKDDEQKLIMRTYDLLKTRKSSPPGKKKSV